MVVLDNGATATSGFQPNCGTHRDAMGREAPALNIEKIARACGVGFVRSIGPDYLDSDLQKLFDEAFHCNDLALIVVKTEFDAPV